MNDHGERYLKIDQFVNYCKQLKVDVSATALEYYEKAKLLFPAARVITPREYLIYMLDIRYNPNNSFYQKTSYEYPSEWEEIHNLLQAINFRIGHDLPGIHILDRMMNNSEYVEQPENLDSVEWSSYKIPVGKIDGSEITESSATHFYHYWQVYQIYEIQRYTDHAFKTTMVNKLSSEERRTFSYYVTIPVPKRRARDGDYLGVSSGFEPLSILSYFYRIKRGQLIMEGKRRTDGFVELDGKSAKCLHKNTRWLSKILSRKYGFDKTAQYKFLEILCSLHDEYIQAEKIKLADAMKVDIARMIRFIQFFSGVDFKAISQRIGRIGGHFEDYLSFLFPDEIEEIRKKAIPTIESHLEAYNKHFPSYQIDEAGMNDFLSFIQNEEFYSLFQSVSDLNDYWFRDRSPVVEAKISELLKDMALLPEKIMDKVGRIGFKSVNFDGYTLLKYIRQFFQKETWLPELENSWKAETNFGDKPATILQLQCLLYEKSLSPAVSHHEILKILLVSGLIRNFYGHRQVLLQDVGKDFMAILRCIFYFVFLIWHQSKINLKLL